MVWPVLLASRSAGLRRDVVSRSGGHFNFRAIRPEDADALQTFVRTLSPEARATLERQAAWLKTYTGVKVLVEGNCDERGTRDYNLALGERRANAVQAFFNSNGVKASQLDTVSYGKEKPVNDGHDEAAWAENRRVEITYQSGEPR